ncbi:ATP-binding protein, partial [Fodinicurvata sp. EGI_FJ10296]|uniref:PAS domain-containing sensor histidine kinase n=1 Tax=Fodinicurvata sp. EGI_FJ10296 TaxID=3231908 RepID=UPI003454ED2E
AVGAALDVRYRHVSPTGLAVDLRVKLVPFHDDVGAPAGFVGIAEDASAQIRAETLAAETERRNAVDSLTAGLAHNLNNILMVIQGNVDQIAAELPDDHPARLNADMTRLANQRAAAITRRLMVYSGQQTSDIRSVPVDAAVARIGAALDTSLPAGVRVTVDPGAGAAATVEVDATLFDETLEELTANARTAVGERGTLQLSSARTDGRDGPMIVITIADNGTGMDGDTRRRAKEPFFTTRAIGQGVGLGLSLADGFARYAGGELSVDSTPGTGTTVTLTLPLHGRA